MNQLRFKLGDRVVGKEGELLIGGKVGTVVLFGSYGYDYGVQFDEAIKDESGCVLGHEFGDSLRYKKGHCRAVSESALEPAPYFVDGQVGDSVYEMGYGDGKINRIDSNPISPIKVIFKKDFLAEGKPLEYSFNFNGEFYDRKQTLFYSKPIFELPSPPKRKVKKVIEGWVNLYESNSAGSYVTNGRIKNTKEQSDDDADDSRLGGALFIRHEYEIED